MIPEGFPFDKLSQPKYKVKVEKDVFIEMRDGVHVAVDVYRPDAEGQFPVLYASSPYQKDLYYLPAVPTFHMRETNKIEWFVERGYVYVNHDIRGCGKSVEGQWQWHSMPERWDHYDVIEWAAAQPWSTGKVGMIGESYYAWTQWMAASLAPPHLACIVPFDGGADMYRDVAYHGGILASGFPSGWHITEIRGHYRVGRKGEDPTQGDWDLAWNVMKHQTIDDFWNDRNPDFKNIKCPVFSVGILHKVGIHLRGNLRGYEEVTTPKKLMLCHGDFEGDEVAIFESIEMRNYLLRWYDHWLKGNDTGIMDEPALNIFVRGQERYRREDDWPLARTEYTDALSFWGQIRSCCLSQRRRPLLGSARGRRGFVHLLLSRSRLDRFLRSGHGGDGPRHPQPLQEDPHVHHASLGEGHRGHREHRARSLRLVRPARHRVPVPHLGPVPRRRAGAGHAARRPHPHPGLAQGVARGHQGRGAEQAVSPVLPARQAASRSNPARSTSTRSRSGARPTASSKGHRLRLDLANGDSNALDFGGHYYGLKVGKDTIYFDKDRPSHLMLPVIPS